MADEPKAKEPEVTKVIGKRAPKQKRKRPSKPTASKKTAGSKKRMVRSFPAASLQDSLQIAEGIQKVAAGHKIRRLTLFDHLKKAPDSGLSRQLITNSSKYGLTTGGYQAEFLELTPDGRIATGTDIAPRDRFAARFKLSITNIEPFKQLYDQYKGNKVPNASVMRDFLVEAGYDEEEVAECVDTFLVNAKYLGILKPMAGAERLLTVEHVSDELPKAGKSTILPDLGATERTATGEKDKSSRADSKGVDWDRICFYIAPIGEEESEARKHSDLFLGSLVEPALEEFELEVVRADQIGKAGLIGRQIIEHIVRAKLVIADLSFHNPNVFYELALRHACRLPTVQIIRAADTIPFDLDQVRTIKIDTSGIYSLVPQLQSYKSEIANQVRRVLDEPDAVENPISVFYPGLKATIS